MDYSFSRGDRLLIELSNYDMFEGDYESGTNDRIDVLNVVESPKGTKIPGVFSYYRTEISSVKLLYREDKEEENSEQKPPTEQHKSVVQISRAEYERLEKMTKDSIYMATMDQRYVNAVHHLNNCESVSVVAVGAEMGRENLVNLLVMCSWDQIYIFDIKSFRHKMFAPELQAILESKSIRKIVHDARRLADCLWHCHKITLRNVFDTQVADFFLLTSEAGSPPQEARSLGECLTCYVNLPVALLEETKKVKEGDWQRRPLDNPLKTVAALKATYLFTLKSKVEQLMLKNFFTGVNLYIDDLKNSDHYSARTTVMSDSLPESLRELLDKHNKSVS